MKYNHLPVNNRPTLMTASWCFTLDVLSILLLLQLSGITSGGETLEYCWPNTFNVSCGVGEVILMNSARYGRMHKGTCLKQTNIHLGCYADVLTELDRRCSGLQKCKIAIPDTKLHEMQPCPADMMAYLEASYDCVQAILPLSIPCNGQRPERLNSPTGFISSSSLISNGAGRPFKCAWTIEVERGQRVNITLYDMAITSGRLDNTGVCLVYGTIKERRDGDITVCRGTERMRNIYISESNTVHLEVIVDPAISSENRYLLKYEAVGCSDPPVPRDAWSRRVGDKVTVSCNHTGETWYLYCSTSKWIGPQRNCTAPPLPEFGHHRHSVFPYILIGVFMGVLIGIGLLIGVLVCEKRRRNRRQKDVVTNPSETECLHSGEIVPRTQADIKLQTHHDPYAAYTHVWELRNVKNPRGDDGPYPDTSQPQDSHHMCQDAPGCVYKDPALFCEHTYNCAQRVYDTSPSKRQRDLKNARFVPVHKTPEGGTFVPNYEAGLHDSIQNPNVMEVDLVPANAN